MSYAVHCAVWADINSLVSSSCVEAQVGDVTYWPVVSQSKDEFTSANSRPNMCLRFLICSADEHDLLPVMVEVVRWARPPSRDG